MHEFKPRIFDHIGTVAHPKVYQAKSFILTKTIQYSQKWGMPEIDDPFWHTTHSMGYVGKLNRKYVDAAWCAGQITQHEFYELNAHDDWCFSMTSPHGIWVRWHNILKEDWIVSRCNYFDRRETWQHRAWEHALWWFFRRSYDKKQLVGILKNLLGETAPQEYKHKIDSSPFRTVCSGAIGAGYEAVRRQGILRAMNQNEAQEWITCDLPTDMKKWKEGMEPWPRLLGKLHLERYAPGHLISRPYFWVVASKNPKYKYVYD